MRNETLVSGARGQADRSAGMTAAEIGEEDRQLHEKLISLKNRRHALEAEELTYLLEAEDTRLYRRRGHVTMVEYMERELCFSPHAASERLRVARAVIELPATRAEFEAGELSFSAVRELTRVVTPKTERAWLEWARGKTATCVQRQVSGLQRGDLPDTEKDPALVTVRIVLEVRQDIAAELKRFRAELDDERGERLSDSDLLEATIRRAREPAPADGQPTPPAAQVALTTCKVCKRTAVHAGGVEAELPPSIAERLLCDSECVGDLEIDAPERVTSAIPASIRRKVWIRDGGGCRVPGCRAARNIDAHHIRFRRHGGGHQMWNILLLCSGHHQQLHEARLTITGRAPDELIFKWARDVDEEHHGEGSPSGDLAAVAEVADVVIEPIREGHAEQTSACLATRSPSWDDAQRSASVPDGAVPA